MLPVNLNEETGKSPALDRVQTAQALLNEDRAAGLELLNDLFRIGALPDPPLDGIYAGEFVAFDIAPVYTPLAGWFASVWMPWKGKVFDAARSHGSNILSRESQAVARLIWPFYRYYQDFGPDMVRAFPFRTYPERSKMDPDLQVLKLDYNLKANPRLNVRRIVDELVQLDAGFYLGRAYLKWWWARWDPVAYFTLTG